MEEEKVHVIDMAFVKFIMEKSGISLKSLATSVGLSSKTVKKYLDGADQGKMPADMPFRFAKAINVPLVRLIHIDYCYLHKEDK